MISLSPCSSIFTSQDKMPYYPIHVDLKGRKCLVIGGGKVAERKVRSLIVCKAEVSVVSPKITTGLKKLMEKERFLYLQKKYEESDLDQAFLVIAATDQSEVNQQIYQDALRRNLLVNVVDSPQCCNFIMPAFVKRGDLLLSVSTGGKSPALARKIRKKLESEFGEEYQPFLEVLGELREKIQGHIRDPLLRKKLFHQILDSDLLDLFRRGDFESAHRRKLALLKEMGLSYG
jgi:precorrin-2 dehydrogenase/sirohydrochlorin ferrochelatase